jgi:hypothetical protein
VLNINIVRSFFKETKIIGTFFKKQIISINCVKHFFLTSCVKYYVVNIVGILFSIKKILIWLFIYFNLTIILVQNIHWQRLI